MKKIRSNRGKQGRTEDYGGKRGQEGKGRGKEMGEASLQTGKRKKRSSMRFRLEGREGDSQVFHFLHLRGWEWAGGD